MRFISVLSVAMAGLWVGGGCGHSDGVRVSGTVTFAGRPVPAGMIYFEPDADRGNAGATGFAKIEDGRYDTSAPGRNRGASGGPQRVRIDGHDPAPPGTVNEAGGRKLFAGYVTTIDLPSAAVVRDFVVPDEAADRPGARRE